MPQYALYALTVLLLAVALMRRPKVSGDLVIPLKPRFRRPPPRIDPDLARMVQHDNKVALPHERIMTPSEFQLLHGKPSRKHPDFTNNDCV